MCRFINDIPPQTSSRSAYKTPLETRLKWSSEEQSDNILVILSGAKDLHEEDVFLEVLYAKKNSRLNFTGQDVYVALGVGKEPGQRQKLSTPQSRIRMSAPPCIRR